MGLTLHISDFLNTEGLTFIPESVTSQFMFKQSKAIQKLLQLGIRAVVDGERYQRGLGNIYDADTQWDTHCLNKFVMCWMLFIGLVLGRRCTAKLPPSISETSIHQSRGLYDTLQFIILQIKCPALRQAFSIDRYWLGSPSDPIFVTRKDVASGGSRISSKEKIRLKRET